MSSSVSRTVAAEIRSLHNGIASSLRQTVKDAIRIGELLAQAKAGLAHGEFLPWVREETGISERTARRYMAVFENRSKTASVADLTDAYRIVEQIETDDTQRKRSAAQETASVSTKEANQAVVDREPETADREPGKRTKLDPGRQAKVDEFKARVMREDAAAKERYESEKVSKEEVDEILRQADAYLKELQEAAERFSHLTLSGGADDAMQTSMLGLTRRYIQSFSPATRQVEVAHNLIKAIRLIIHEVNGEEA